MLPALTFSTKRPLPRRAVIISVGGALLALALAGFVLGAPTATGGRPPTPQPLVDRLSPSTWALAVPIAWLAAPVAEVRAGESVDLLAVRVGERPLAVPIAADLRVMGSDDVAIVFQVDEESATAIATARASSLLIVPLVRSSR